MSGSASAGAQGRVEVSEPAEAVEHLADRRADRLAPAGADVSPGDLAQEDDPSAEPQGVDQADASDHAPDARPDARSVVVVLATGAWVQQEPDPDPLDPPGEVAPGVLRRAVAGDDRAFATLVEHYDPMLRQLTFHLLGERTAMDDVLQITYVKAYRALPRLTVEVEPGPWLYRLAYLACLDELRRRHRHPGRAPRPPGPPPSCDEAPRSGFERAFAGLPADRRTAVILADRFGVELRAVATVLGLPEAATVHMLGRARAVLHAALDEDAPEPDLDVR